MSPPAHAASLLNRRLTIHPTVRRTLPGPVSASDWWLIHAIDGKADDCRVTLLYKGRWSDAPADVGDDRRYTLGEVRSLLHMGDLQLE